MAMAMKGAIDAIEAHFMRDDFRVVFGPPKHDA